MAKRNDPVGHFYDKVREKAGQKEGIAQRNAIFRAGAAGAVGGGIVGSGLGPFGIALGAALGGTAGGAAGSVIGAVHGAHEAQKIKKSRIRAERAYKGVMK